jgi:hypothetical protein
MADISLVVEVKQKGVVNAVKGTKALEGNVKLLSDSFKKGDLSQRQYYKGISQLAQAANKSESELRKYANELRKIEKASNNAKVAAKAEATAVKAYAQARKQATEANARFNAKAKEATAVARANTLEEERLKNKFVEGYTAMNIYTKELNDLAVARKRGIIGANEQAAAVARLNTQMKAGTGVFANSAAGMQVVGKRANRAGVLAQQAGYQFGDFAVQVQSGTNIMVAAGQQATQLVGTFSMLAKTTKMISLFAGLGVIIPILTGIGAYLMRTAEASDEAAESTEELDERIKSITQSLKDYARAQDAIRLGVSVDFLDLSDNVKNAEEALAEARRDLEAKNDAAEAANFAAGLGGGGMFSGMLTRSLAGSPEDLAKAVEALEEAEQSLADLRQKEADTRASNFAKSSLAMDQELALLREQAAFGESSAEAKNVAAKQELDNRIAAIDAQVESGELDATAAISLKQQVRLAAALGKMIEENNTLEGIREEVAAREQNLRLLEIEKDHTKDSTEYRAELVKQEEARLNALYAQHPAAQALVADALALYEAELKVTAEMEASADAAQGIGDALQSAIDQANVFASAMERAANASAGINISTAGINAEVAALEGGASRAEARATAAAVSERERLTSALPSFEAGPRSSARIEGLVQERYDVTLANQQALARRAELTKTPSTGGGGGGSDPFDQDEYLKSLQEEADFKQSLVGINDEAVTNMERRREITKRIEDEGLVADEERILSLVLTEAATRRAIAAEEQRQATFDMVSGHIETAFMAMVDGSKSVEDAFKGMLRNILIEVYKQAVAKPIVGGIMSFLGFKDGGAFSGGNVIPFANGGVVSSATMFPMAGNQTGVMGEAGPEAIMPLKRGANGKLGVQVQGGGENVVIHQNFNFQANGDDSVKRIIAQAAPQIANITKKSMMDDRRRGGQMKTTFG